MKKIVSLIVLFFLSLSTCACDKDSNVIGGSDGPTEIVIVDTDSNVYTKEDLEYLQDTDYFLESAIEHIFLGQINRKGDATGYHYDGIENSPGSIVEGTKTSPDENEVYTGQVVVDGVQKTGNKGYSSFYPESLSPQEVVYAINEAYEEKVHVRSNVYRGETSYGFIVEMYLTEDDKIISAFPIYEG
ncbi:MAG: EndoU domain-containing protein [Bacillota bacterium]|nr:EndoU domain-containing protein [Bacillota bacterium]